MLEKGKLPSYITSKFALPESSPKHKDLEFEVVKLRLIAHNHKMEKFQENITRLFADIKMYMSDASVAQIKSHVDEYAEAMTKECPLVLWMLVIKSHTYAEREASFAEKQKARSKRRTYTRDPSAYRSII